MKILVPHLVRSFVGWWWFEVLVGSGEVIDIFLQLCASIAIVPLVFFHDSGLPTKLFILALVVVVWMFFFDLVVFICINCMRYWVPYCYLIWCMSIWTYVLRDLRA